MKDFKDDNEKREFLVPICARYRIFLQKWLDVTKSEFREIICRRLDITEGEYHLKNLSLGDIINMIQELKMFKYELTGSKRLPKNVNPRAYALKVKNKNKEEF
jgi:hypothetical protein